jgi:hypothetical protein
MYTQTYLGLIVIFAVIFGIPGRVKGVLANQQRKGRPPEFVRVKVTATNIIM